MAITYYTRIFGKKQSRYSMKITNEIQKELIQLENDRQQTKELLAAEQIRIASLLQNDMGKEINDVLSGKKIIKLSLYKRIKYTLRFYLNKLFNYF